MTLPSLHCDFETRSAVDLKKTGVHVYAADASTDIWCLRYAFGDEGVELWVPGQRPPLRVIEHIEAGGLLIAHNAAFERAIWHYILAPRYGFPEPAVEQWRCTMSFGYAMALPGSLEHMVPALGIDTIKDMTGHRLMMSMARPRKPKKGEPDGLYWRDSEENKQRLYAYCASDVEAERAADRRLVRLRPSEQALWHLDQRINDRGVPVDVELCRRALAIVEAHMKTLDGEMAHLTDWEVTACSNVNQIKTFVKSRGIVLGEKLNKKTMQYVDTLDKEFVNELLARSDVDPLARRVLELRQEAGKASVSKIDALLNGMSADGRARGLTQFHAANTGRWGGRRFQPQNIIRPDEEFDVDSAIDVVMNLPTGCALQKLDTLYGPPLTCISYMLRGMVAPPAGRKIVAADFSNIEGRVLAWLAGERRKLDAFSAFDAGTGPDLYLVAAAGIYGVPLASLSKKSPERQIGKVAELACGYQGGVGAFQTMAHTYGVKVPDDQADEIKTAWRESNPNIVRFWWDLEEAALNAIANPGKVAQCGPIAFRVVGSFLWCRLPSGRALCYPYPAIRSVMTPWGEPKDAVTFKTVPNVSNVRKIVEDPTNTSRWARISTYGGGLAENVTQAVARDVLAEAMVRLEAHGYPIILHVHDEAVAEVDEGFGSKAEFEQIMAEPAPWMKGLPIAASGFEARRYQK